MKDIKDYEGLYAITSCGKVWSYKSKKFLKSCDDGHGYQVVTLYKNGNYENKRIHRLVAEAYLPNPNNLPEVDHIISVSKDGKDNVQNLQWITKENNIKKATRKKIYCRELDKVYESQTQAAKELGLDQGNISKVCRGIHSQTGGYHFEFYYGGIDNE